MDLQIKGNCSIFKVLSPKKRLLWSSNPPRNRPNFGEILLMVQKIRRENQLRLVLYPVIYEVLYVFGGAGFPSKMRLIRQSSLQDNLICSCPFLVQIPRA